MTAKPDGTGSYELSQPLFPVRCLERHLPLSLSDVDYCELIGWVVDASAETIDESRRRRPISEFSNSKE